MKWKKASDDEWVLYLTSSGEKIGGVQKLFYDAYAGHLYITGDVGEFESLGDAKDWVEKQAWLEIGGGRR